MTAFRVKTRDLAHRPEDGSRAFERRYRRRVVQNRARRKSDRWTVRTYKAKDILRSSGLEALGRKNFHVAADLTKISTGKKLSPILLLRDVERHVLVIADGFHRVCASKLLDEDTIIPARIVTTP